MTDELFLDAFAPSRRLLLLVQNANAQPCGSDILQKPAPVPSRGHGLRSYRWKDTLIQLATKPA
jgi:hypothetical protein